eukprot:1970986-Amphidinium_carterae.1
MGLLKRKRSDLEGRTAGSQYSCHCSIAKRGLVFTKSVAVDLEPGPLLLSECESYSQSKCLACSVRFHSLSLKTGFPSGLVVRRSRGLVPKEEDCFGRGAAAMKSADEVMQYTAPQPKENEVAG